MILTWLITAAAYWLGLLLSRLPEGQLPDAAVNAVLYFWAAINAFTFIFPAGTFLLVLAIMWAVDNYMLGFKIMLWIYKRIPFIGK